MIDAITINKISAALAARQITTIAAAIEETQTNRAVHVAAKRDLEIIACDLRLAALRRCENKKNKPHLIATWIENTKTRLRSAREVAEAERDPAKRDHAESWIQEINLRAFYDAYIICVKDIQPAQQPASSAPSLSMRDIRLAALAANAPPLFKPDLVGEFLNKDNEPSKERGW